MLTSLQWTAVFGMVMIALFFAVEIAKWRAMARIMSRGQRILRALTFVAAELLFVMMLIGPKVTSHSRPLITLTYWSVCLALGLTVVALALLTALTTLREYSQLNRRAFRELKDGPHPEQRRRIGGNGHET